VTSDIPDPYAPEDQPPSDQSDDWEVRIGKDGYIRLSPEFVGAFLAERLAWGRTAPKLPAGAAKRSRKGEPQDQPVWYGIHRAAALLDENPESLRKKLDRASRRGANGEVTADLNGIRGRMLGHRWKVHIPAGWTTGGEQ
jgi:hypothetical protein